MSMSPRCKTCDEKLIIKKKFAFMACICHDDARILGLDEIKHGLYYECVYLSDEQSGRHHYEESKKTDKNNVLV